MNLVSLSKRWAPISGFERRGIMGSAVMSRNTCNQKHADFSKHHKVSSRLSRRLEYQLRAFPDISRFVMVRM